MKGRGVTRAIFINWPERLNCPFSPAWLALVLREKVLHYQFMKEIIFGSFILMLNHNFVKALNRRAH